jgi:signal transduction histidine kinase
VEIPDPYAPDREFRRDLQGRVDELQYLLRDETTVRDLIWGFLTGVVGFVLAFLPLGLIIYGVQGFIQAPLWLAFHSNIGYHSDYSGLPVNGLGYALLAVPIGAGYLLAGFTQGPALLKAHGRWTVQMLNPTQAALERRVRELTESRAEAVDASAAELRRIERDLHDGAQARLVAMGMTLGAIEHLLEKEPEKAKQLLAETRLASTKALHELRDLVRGIHPPVLADRGLSDAVKALALDSPLKVEVSSSLAGRLEPPLESAAYFAVSEVLTNAAKHAEAKRVWIELAHDGRLLKISVTDDGKGGASLDAGTGLRGIERRIGAFDGVLALSSPIGGPTVVSMEIPSPNPVPQT